MSTSELNVLETASAMLEESSSIMTMKKSDDENDDAGGNNSKVQDKNKNTPMKRAALSELALNSPLKQANMGALVVSSTRRATRSASKDSIMAVALSPGHGGRNLAVVLPARLQDDTKATGNDKMSLTKELSSLFQESSNNDVSCMTTPYEEWKAEFQSFLRENGFLGSLLIRGIDNADDQSLLTSTKKTSRVRCSTRGQSLLLSSSRYNVLSDHERKSLLTKQDLESLRYILITKSRSDKLRFIQDKLLQGESEIRYDQHGSFSRHVHRIVVKNCFRNTMKNEKRQAARLDWLIAVTHNLLEYDAWMYDHPQDESDDMALMVKRLAGYWTRLFYKAQQKKNGKKEDLGWDDEYTKPGVMELLSQFQSKVDACPSLGAFEYAIAD